MSLGADGMPCLQVVQLKAVFPHGAGFVLAFEFMLSDLAEVVRHTQRPLAQAQVKSYLQMLLKGVSFCHANNIVHRVSPSMGWSGAWGPVGLGLDQPLEKTRPETGSEGVGLWVSTLGCVLQRVGTWADPGAQPAKPQGPPGALEELMLPLVLRT